MDEKTLGKKMGGALRSSEENAALALVAIARAELIDDVTIAEHAGLFIFWDENWRGARGDIVRDGEGLYRSIHDVLNAGQNTKPSETPSMWSPVGDPAEEWPYWSAPVGAHDAYPLGAKTSHAGKYWISGVDSNVWEPGAYGWTLAAS
jgi:hypothetical protein